MKTFFSLAVQPVDRDSGDTGDSDVDGNVLFVTLSRMNCRMNCSIIVECVRYIPVCDIYLYGSN